MEYFLQQLINGLTLGAIYGLIAIGYTMVYGIIGMINFAHGDVFMIGGMTSLIRDGETGLHVGPRDAADLAAKMTWLFDHPEVRERMGRAARHLFEDDYAPEKNYRLLMDIYRDVISERTAGRSKS